MTWQITVPTRKSRETMDLEEVGLMVFTRLNEAQAETSDGQSGSSSDTLRDCGNSDASETIIMWICSLAFLI